MSSEGAMAGEEVGSLEVFDGDKDDSISLEISGQHGRVFGITEAGELFIRDLTFLTGPEAHIVTAEDSGSPPRRASVPQCYNWMEARRREGQAEGQTSLWERSDRQTSRVGPADLPGRPLIETLKSPSSSISPLCPAGVPVSADKPYFEIEISNLCVEGGGSPVIGLCSPLGPRLTLW